MGYESAAAQDMPHPAIRFGTGYHVLPDSRVSAATKWHLVSTKNSLNPPACFCVLTSRLFRCIRTNSMACRYALPNRRAATLLIWNRLHLASEVMNPSNVLTGTHMIQGDRTTWHK